ncbi:MAG: hypothetical protein IJQ88_08985 [Clostridia bacterium]|nr:hypothetical protein [Clostridia bacterium]
MSVAKGDRKQGSDNLEVEELAKGLCVYTIQICKNEKNFPKRDRWILTNEIVSCAVKAYGKIREANSITVTTLDDYMLRRKDQIKARKKLKRMEGLVEIAGDVLSLEEGRIEYWGNFVRKTLDLLAKWRAGDRKRYAGKLGSKADKTIQPGNPL